jgi:hypothetical protein
MDRNELTDKIGRLVSEVLEAPTEKLRGFLPMSTSVEIPPGATAQITTRPQLPFRGDRLAVWSVNAASFMIESMQVGNRHLGAQAGAIPADAFATRLDFLPVLDAALKKHGVVELKLAKSAVEVFGQPIAMPKTAVGIEITMYVTNVSEKPQRFVAILFGDQDYV